MGSDNEKFSSAIYDKETKKVLVTNTIAEHCEGSQNKILQQIDHVLKKSNDGSGLVATILSGGYTNYSYKVFIDKHPEICLFAKLAFEFALWNPDKSVHYDLQRTENEWQIMKIFSKLKPEYIATPIGCWDLEQDGLKMKLIVTEWSTADEQFSNQFIDGTVDPRIAPKLAEALAELHNIKDFDPNFNQNVKPCMENLLKHMKTGLEVASKQLNPEDRTGAFCVASGKDGLNKIAEAVIANYHKRDCLVHSDSHVFNVLVEAKPSIDNLDSFGPDGSMVLCDWEMAFAGPIGKDIGLALAFPIGCMIAHAINGHSDARKSLQSYIDDLWDSYSSKLMEAGKTPDEMAVIQKNIVGWCGCFQFLAFYYIGCQREFFPVENEEMRKNVHDALGVLGLKLMRFSFDSAFGADYTSSETIKTFFKSLYNDEMNRAYSLYETSIKRMKPRKSSLLRASNRRFSDARMNFLTDLSLSDLSGDDITDAAQ